MPGFWHSFTLLQMTGNHFHGHNKTGNRNPGSKCDRDFITFSTIKSRL